MNKVLKKIITFLFTGVFLVFSAFPALADTSTTAVEPIEPVGPQSTAGIVQPVGPQEQTGPIQPVGPQPVSSTPVADPAAATTQNSTSQSNSATGADSTNQNSSQSTGNTTNTVNNTANVQNSANLTLSSGSNTLTQNSSVDSLKTGNANASVNLLNIANSQFAPGSSVGAQTIDGSQTTDLTIAQSGPSGSSVLIPSVLGGSSSSVQTNSATGSGSLNTNNLDNHNVVSFLTNNLANIGNSIGINASTGSNNILANTKIGSIATGNINLGANLINLANIINPQLQLEVGIWSILNGLKGDLIIPDLANTATGSASANTNAVNNSNSTTTTTNNNANVNNTFGLQTNTGDNTLAANSSVGSVTTGSTQTGGSTVNLANDTPVFYIINVFGKVIGNAINQMFGTNYIINQVSDPGSQSSGVADASASNNLTGADSTNSNSVDNNNATTVTTNNTANVNNAININADTGHNTISRNTLVGSIATGSINVITNVVNIINSLAQRVGKFKLGIINIFGDFGGSVLTKSKPPVTIPGNDTGQTTATATTTTTAATTTTTVNPPTGSVLGATTAATNPQQGEKGGGTAESTTPIVLAAQTSVSPSPKVVAAGSSNPEAGTQNSLAYYLLAPLIALLGMTGVEGFGWLKRRRAVALIRTIKK